MARARNIKPGFYKNEDLAECSVWARLIFPGLWMLADKNGVLEDRPKRIKAELLPFDSQEIDPLLSELEGRSLIVRFENNGASYIWIPGFLKHQTPHYSEKGIGIMPPTFSESRGQEDTSSPRVLSEHSENQDPIKAGSNAPSSLNPSSLNPESLDPPPRRVHGFPPGFDEFWAAYPRHVAKQDAVKAFAKLRADDALLRRILDSLAAAKASPDWRKDDGRFVPHAATWLNGKRWEDELAPVEIPAWEGAK